MSVPATVTGALVSRASSRPAGLPRWVVPGRAARGAARCSSLLEVVTGAHDLASSGTIAATLIATTPIMLAGLGGLWSERAGVVNIGLEGMMILGTYGAGYFGYHYGAWAGVLGAIAMGMLGGLLHAIATVIFGVDHIISGVAINIIALGAVQYLASLTFVGLPGRRLHPVAQDPGRPDDHDRVAERQAARDREERLVLRLRAGGAAARPVHQPVVPGDHLVPAADRDLVASCGAPRSACGCAPAARARRRPSRSACTCCATSSSAVLVSGGLAGLGGGVLAMVASSNYRDGQTGGRGYIGLAAMIFGNWRPGRAARRARGCSATPRRSGCARAATSVHALLLAAAVLALVAAASPGAPGQPGHRRRSWPASACCSGVTYFLIDEVPGDFTRMTPYVITLVVLAFASQRLRMPAADGQVYRKGSAG